jgi:flagellar basal body P-ring formation protein FlgA
MTLRFLFTLALCAFAFSAFAQTAPAEVDVAVTARDIPRGAVLAEADLVYKPIAAARANDSIARSIADLAGMETRRALRAGELIRTIDVKRHALVAKGATVTMLFEADGVALSSIGRAMAEGSEGDIVTVLNPTSYRQVQAVVTGPGTVRVGGVAQTVTRLGAAR